MDEILEKDDINLLEHNSSIRVTIPKKWRKILNLDSEDVEAEAALVNGEGGLFFAVWPKDRAEIR